MISTGNTPKTSETGRPPGTTLWILILVMVVTIVPLIVVCQIIAYWRVDVVDDQMFGYFGWRIAHGAAVYLDVWDNKPPGIYWINAVGMLVGHDSYFGVIAMCVVALIVAHAAFFIVGSSVYHRGAAALGTILLSFFLTHGFYTGGTNRTETFLVACELVAVAFYMRGFARDRWWKWYCAGVFCGLAFLFKQVGLTGWGCMGLHTIILVIVHQLTVRTGLKRCLLLLGGACTSVALAACYLAWQGALSDAIYATFGFNQAYFTAGTSRFPYNLVNWFLLREHVRPILLLPLLMAVAAAIHAFLWWLRPQYRPPEIEKPLLALRPVCPRHFLLFTMWFLVAFYGALLSPHGFRHYLVPSIPPLLLMATYLVNVLRAETKLLRRLQQRAWVTVAFIIMAYFSYESVRLQFEEVSKVWVARIDPWMLKAGWHEPGTPGIGEYKPARWEAVGDAVIALSEPEDKIQCLGYMPGVYLHSRRVNVSRYTTTEKIGQVRGRKEAADIAGELEQTLRDDPPVLLIMSSEDFFGLHGRDPKRAWPVWTALDEWMDENYTLVQDIARFGTVYIFKRNDRFDPQRDPDLSSRLEAIKKKLQESR
ncbi:MAG: glycosyltransferase family 39 protein [Phycisphaerae bacterium]|nr:glycosyltransferase family 39 protein [Phycisphaerae bacterium]